MAEVLSGFICGFAFSIIATPPFAVWVLNSRDDIPFIRNAVPKGMPLTLLSIPIASFFFLIWTELGLVFGLVLLAVSGSARDGLGSPNLFFTFAILLSAFIVFFPFYLVVRSGRRLALFLAFTYVAVFGWAMPILADFASTRVA